MRRRHERAHFPIRWANECIAALNGLYGTVLRRDDESGRLIVSIEGNGSHKIKADNLRVV